MNVQRGNGMDFSGSEYIISLFHNVAKFMLMQVIPMWKILDKLSRNTLQRTFCNIEKKNSVVRQMSVNSQT